MRIHSDLADTIGNTPLLKLKRASQMTGCTILGKCEFLNPGQSVKDRAALYIIKDAVAKGLLKPGGTIVITTPNDEDLEKTHVHCADCGATFHHMQHIRSWNVNNLGKLMSEFTFQPKFCAGVNIQWYGKNGYAHLLVDRLKNAFRTSKNANLVFIGKK